MPPTLQPLLSFLSKIFTSSFPSSSSTPWPQAPTLHTTIPHEGHYTSTPLTRALPSTPTIYTLQAASPLFAKLPLELRSIIWTYVMGGHTIHLHYEGDSSLRSIACRAQRLHSCGSAAHGGGGFGRCRPFRGSGEMGYREMVGNEEMGWVGVMRVCRAMYFETVHILYSTSTFDLSDCWTLTPHLPWTIPLHSLSQISRVSVTILDLYASPGAINYASWQSLWATLDLLRGLKDLRVEIASKEKYEKATMTAEELGKVEEELLAYLKVLESVPGHRKARWELVLPGEEREEGAEVAEGLVRSGWRITRTGR